MKHHFKHIEIQQQGDVFCVKLLQKQFDENGLNALSAEVAHLIDRNGCRKMVLSLGPEDTLCLYSVFLAKLVNLQRRLDAVGGTLALAGLSDTTQHIFQVTGLNKLFTFYPDVDKAAEALGTKEPTKSP